MEHECTFFYSQAHHTMLTWNPARTCLFVALSSLSLSLSLSFSLALSPSRVCKKQLGSITGREWIYQIANGYGRVRSCRCVNATSCWMNRMHLLLHRHDASVDRESIQKQLVLMKHELLTARTQVEVQRCAAKRRRAHATRRGARRH